MLKSRRAETSGNGEGGGGGVEGARPAHPRGRNSFEGKIRGKRAPGPERVGGPTQTASIGLQIRAASALPFSWMVVRIFFSSVVAFSPEPRRLWNLSELFHSCFREI